MTQEPPRFRLFPFKGLGQIQFGSTADEVIERLGLPDQKREIKDPFNSASFAPTLVRLLEINGSVNGVVFNNGGIVRVRGLSAVVHMYGGTLQVSGKVNRVIGNGDLYYMRGSIIEGMPVQ